jgi:hypothetical protein
MEPVNKNRRFTVILTHITNFHPGFGKSMIINFELASTKLSNHIYQFQQSMLFCDGLFTVIYMQGGSLAAGLLLLLRSRLCTGKFKLFIYNRYSRKRYIEEQHSMITFSFSDAHLTDTALFISFSYYKLQKVWSVGFCFSPSWMYCPTQKEMDCKCYQVTWLLIRPITEYKRSVKVQHFKCKLGV